MQDRRIAIAILILLGIAIVSARTLYLQSQDPFALKSRVSYISIISAPRAKILDRNGKVLAEDERSFDLYLLLNEFEKDPENLSTLRQILNIDEPLYALYEKLNQKLSNKKLWLAERRFPQALMKDIPFEAAVKIEINTKLQGVIVKETLRRNYPNGKSACHILGHIGRIKKEEIENLDEESIPEHLLAILRTRQELYDEVRGRLGVEYQFDHILRSRHGFQITERDTKTGEKKNIILKDPIPGENVTLTIDIEIQKRIERILEKQTHNGSIIVLDTKSGEVLALVNKPFFDPNHFVPPVKQENIKSYFEPESHRLFRNRAVQDDYQLGSIFKIVTGLAALEEKKLDQSRTINCTGKYFKRDDAFRCWIYRQNRGAHDHLDLAGAIARSCNIFFFELGKELGIPTLKKWGSDFGFGEKTGIDLPFEAKGKLPRDSNAITDAISFAIGQGELTTTPIQVAKLFTIIANDGVVLQPHIMANDNLTKGKLKLDQNNIQYIKKGLKAACKEHYGTAHSLSDLDVMGKTSSAQTATTTNAHAWFGGLYKNYAIVVLVEYAGGGGEMAVPIFREIVTGLR